MQPGKKRTLAELQPVETIQITPEMAALADNAAQKATDGATEAMKREAMGKIHHHLRAMRIALERLDQRVEELDKRMARCSERVTAFDTEWGQMRERWEGMLRYCYRVCKHDAVKQLAEIDPPDANRVPSRPWHGATKQQEEPKRRGDPLFDEPPEF